MKKGKWTLEEIAEENGLFGTALHVKALSITQEDHFDSNTAGDCHKGSKMIAYVCQ